MQKKMAPALAFRLMSIGWDLADRPVNRAPKEKKKPDQKKTAMRRMQRASRRRNRGR